MTPRRSDSELPVIAAIARDVLRLGVGGRLPTTLDYQERFGVGSGTVQKALRELRLDRAVSVVSRGHQGTFVTELDSARLWHHGELPPVHILLPIPGAVEPQAVAYALARQLEKIQANATIGFRGGAESRLEAVDNGDADVAVVSAGAADDLSPDDKHVRVELGRGTYYQDGSLVVVRRADAPDGHGRIGIDPRSDDHQRFTRAEFPDESNDFTETDFTTIPRAVLEGSIDTGIWHVADSLIPLELAGLRSHPLSTPRARQLACECSGAVILARNDTVVGAMLSRVDVDAVRTGWDEAIARGRRELQAYSRITLDD